MNHSPTKRNRWVAAALALAIVVFAPATNAATSPTRDAPAHRDLASEVHQRITARLPDNAASIRVTARGTEIMLAGEVDLLSKRAIAREAAETVRGVARVENQITVRPERRPDEIVRVDVKNAIGAERVTATEEIDVSTEDGIVTLRGLVGSVAQKSLAAWIAANERGVREVRNELRVAPVTRNDEELRADLVRLFDENPIYSNNALSVAVSRGAVVLSGTVDTLWEKQRAERDAWVPGVVYVDVANLRVTDLAPTGRTPPRTAQEIDRDLRAAVATNAALANNELKPEIKDGDVVLTGEVDSYFEKTVAEDLVRHVPGVTAVTNQLAIRGNNFAQRAEHYHAPAGWKSPPPTITPGQSPEEADAKLKAAIEQAFAADPRLLGENIEVAVKRGVVTLRGAVEAIKQTAAVEVARETGARVVKPEFKPELLP